MGTGLAVSVLAQQGDPPPPDDFFPTAPRTTVYEQPPLTPTLSPNELQIQRDDTQQERKARTLGSTIELCDDTKIQLPPDTWIYNTRIGVSDYHVGYPIETIPCPKDKVSIVKNYFLAKDNSFAVLNWSGTSIEPCLAPGEETSFDWLYERLGLEKAPGTRQRLCPNPESIP